MLYLAIKYTIPINSVFAVLMGIFCSINCKHFIRKTDAKLHSINLIVNYPLVQIEHGNLINLKDTIPIYYYEDYILYKLPHIKTTENEKSILSEEKLYRIFIFKNESAYGYLYSNISDSIGEKLKVDSMLFQKGFATNFNADSDTLIEVKSIKSDSDIIKKYIPKRFYGETNYDSIFYYYNKQFNSTDYSFSKSLSRVGNLKLYRVRIIYNEKYSGTLKKNSPKREFNFEIINRNMDDQSKIIAFCNYFKSLKLEMD